MIRSHSDDPFLDLIENASFEPNWVYLSPACLKRAEAMQRELSKLPGYKDVMKKFEIGVLFKRCK